MKISNLIGMTMDVDHENSFAASAELASKEAKLNELIDVVRQRLHVRRPVFPLPPRTDKDFLAKFVRCKKYIPEDAATAIEKYYDNIYNNLRLLQGVYSKDFEPYYYMDVMRLLKRKVHGTSGFYTKIGNWDPKVASIRQLEVAGAYVFEECFQDPSIQVNGLVCISDMSGFGFTHARQITYHELKFLFKCIFEMFPMRLVACHLINIPLVFWPVYKLVMKVLPKKLQQRLHVHNDLASLASELGHENVPKSLGGVLSEDEAWDNDLRSKILNENRCYDTYWNGGACPRVSRRLSRKRSSMMMTS